MTASERDALVGRVREELEKAIDALPLAWDSRDLGAPLARVATAMCDAYRTTIADYDSRVGALQAEVERLTRERDDWKTLHKRCQLAEAEVERLTRERDAERQAREVTFRWYDERRAEVLRLTAEVERLTRERDEWVDRSLVLASESRVAVLTAEVERLREDAARLDYMDTQRNWTRWMGRDTGDGYTVWPVSGSDSFRAAIDAARTTGGRDA